MAVEKSPAFQFYPKEFLTDGNVAGMSLQERGAYITLICICWQEGSLPASADRLANMVSTPLKAFQKFWPSVRACFIERDGRLFHKRLDLERTKQEVYRRRQSDKGAASAAARAAKHATESQPNGNRGSTPVQPDGQPNVNSPISDLQKEHTRAIVDDETEARARHFLERYPQIYAEFRGGAHYHVKEARDFPKVLELVTGWPNEERLEEMFKVFLHLKGRDVLNQPGSPGQFLHHAPECDALLRQAGR